MGEELPPVSCPDCGMDWRIFAHDDEKNLYVACGCEDKEPEQMHEWAKRFREEEWDMDDHIKGYR